MKTLTILGLALLLLGSSSFAGDRTTAAPHPKNQAYACQVREADLHGWPIRRGMSARRLVSKDQLPDTRLSNDIWIYSRFHAVPLHREAPECTNLMVTFNDGVVTDLHLVNERAVIIIAGDPQAFSNGLLAAKR